MAKKEIRSKYIQSAMLDSSQLTASLQDVVEESVRNFLGAGVKEQLKKVINEGTEDEFTVEEVPDTEDNAAVEPEEGAEGNSKKNGENEDNQNTDPEGDNADAGEGEDNGENTDPAEGEGEADDDIWNEIESYRNEDGEYDLSKCEDGDCVARVLKVLTDEDGVRVAKNTDGTIDLTDDNTQQEYIIDLNGCGSEGEGGEAPVSESNVNLGYTDSYQNKTTMTTPSNNEPANSSTTYSMDGGAPTGTESPIGNEGDRAPFDKNVSESEEIIEIDLGDGEGGCDIQETMTTQEQGPLSRGTSMTHTNNNSKSAKGRNARSEGEQKTGTGESPYKPEQMEAIMRKANAIFMENKKYREAFGQMQEQNKKYREAFGQMQEQNKQLMDINSKLQTRLGEAKVVMKSFGNIAKCITENAMTMNEKKQLFQVLSKAKTVEESDQLCEAFVQRIKQTERPAFNLGNAQPAQISESRNLSGQQNQGAPLNEGTGMQESISLIDRMDSIYG